MRFLVPSFFLLACATALFADEPVRVTTLSSVLTEVAEEVGGRRVVVTALVRPGTDPHDYEPKPADLAVVAQAQLVLASGKNLEGYLKKLPESSGTRAPVVSVGDRFPSLKLTSGGEHAHGSIEDPHWWNSIANVQIAAEIVRDEFIKLDPAGALEYKNSAAIYNDRLAALQKWAKIKISELPRDQRKLITSHDAFQYFAQEFGFTIYAIEGISTEDEPSNREVVHLIDTIKKQRVKAIFGEFGSNSKVLEVITRESGAKLGGELYPDGLGPGEAATYEGMMKHNLNTIVNSLK